MTKSIIFTVVTLVLFGIFVGIISSDETETNWAKFKLIMSFIGLFGIPYLAGIEFHNIKKKLFD